MAKSFEERCQAAMKPSSRAPDVRAVLEDMENLLSELNAKASEFRQRSLDLNVNGDEARIARASADDTTFEIDRLEAIKPRLHERLEQIEECDRQRAADEARQRLADETATLAAKLADRWPVLTGELIELLGDLEANSHAVDAYNRGQPQHARIVCAEFQARGVTGASWPNLGGWVERLFTMRIPGLTQPRDAWPIDHQAAMVAEMNALQHARIIAAKERSSPEALEEARRREEARWTRYEVSQKPYRGYMISGIKHREGTSGVAQHPIFLWMHNGHRKAAEELGLTVEPSPLASSAKADAA
ncbi:hypothetical protein [Sphingomonas agri]|uniref:hypothetical protein n=1 Tax=Sphingomonas agri TaxID=1813878 RepID=UPI00311D4DA8